VLASTLSGDYGRGMDPSEWKKFHLHSLVGTCADGRPLVAADSEHLNATLKGTTVTGSGAVRDTSVHVTRSVTFGDNDIGVSVRLDQSHQLNLLNLWTNSKLHGRVTEVYEMIPFVPNQKRQPKKKLEPTAITLFDGEGKSAGDLSETPTPAKTIVIDRGGFGVRIELDEARNVQRGENNTLLVQVVDKVALAEEVTLKYKLVPYTRSARLSP
jgi:hypothetical protein